MVTPGQLQKKTDLLAVIQTLANSKTNLPHKPFTVDLHHGPVHDRGIFVLGNTYNDGDQVDHLGYLFIANGNGITAPPLDPDTHNPNAGWRQPWQSCYQRVRDSLHVALDDSILGVDPWDKSISGPWPCQFPDILYNHLEFYYPDTGQQERVTLGGSSPNTIGGAPAQVNGRFTAVTTELMVGPLSPGQLGGDIIPFGTPAVQTGEYPNLVITAVTGPANLPDNEGQYLLEYASAVEFKIAIGGTRPVTVNTTIIARATVRRGLTLISDPNNGTSIIQADDGDPSGLIQVTTDFPGANFVKSFSGWVLSSGSNDVYTGIVELTATVNSDIPPGDYTVNISSDVLPNNRASGVILINTDTRVFSGSNTWAFDTFADISPLMLIRGTCGLIATDTFEVPGIHDSKRVLKIPAPPFNPATDMPTGIWTGQALYRPSNPVIGQQPAAIGVTPAGYIPETGYVSPWIFVRTIYLNQFGLAYSSSTPGFWFGITPPVQSLGLIPYDRMPWNIFPITEGASNFGNAVKNDFLGYKPPYFYGKLVTGVEAQWAYAQDAPAWTNLFNSNESNPWPKRWKPLVHYPLGYSIQDANGNLARVDLEGRSGISEPEWPGGDGATITEPDYVNSSTHQTDTGVRWKIYKVLKKPETIKRSTAYALGQTLVDANGNSQTITVDGTTNADAEPNWNKTILGLTTDGTATWQLTAFGAIQPAVAHITPALYPSFWQNPSAGQTDPAPILTNAVVDTHGNRPFDFKPQGWWIYRVAINRIPQTKTTDKPPTAPIAVKIGCIRNGAFVEFGTYQTGQVVNAYWPVFASPMANPTALCYQASERVDIQAAILTCGVGYGTWGHVDFPFAATYLNDVEVLLGKI